MAANGSNGIYKFYISIQRFEINFLKSLPSSPAYRQAGFAKGRKNISPPFDKGGYRGIR
jgi:hypothetical protein